MRTVTSVVVAGESVVVTRGGATLALTVHTGAALLRLTGWWRPLAELTPLGVEPLVATLVRNGVSYNLSDTREDYAVAARVLNDSGVFA
jgi:hypothetical protein